jgi:hypothetical protein
MIILKKDWFSGGILFDKNRLNDCIILDLWKLK